MRQHCNRVRQGEAAGSGGQVLARIERALCGADLLLQAGGFSVIVLDLAGIAPDHAARVPFANLISIPRRRRADTRRPAR